MKELIISFVLTKLYVPYSVFRIPCFKDCQGESLKHGIRNHFVCLMSSNYLQLCSLDHSFSTREEGQIVMKFMNFEAQRIQSTN